MHQNVKYSVNIPVPAGFQKWSVEKQEGYLKGYRRAEKEKRKELQKLTAQKAKQDFDHAGESYPYNFLCEICRKNSLDTEMAYKVSPYSFTEFCQHDLKENERSVVKLRFQDHLTLKECGLEMGVTPERIRQILARIERKIRRDFNFVYHLETVPVYRYHQTENILAREKAISESWKEKYEEAVGRAAYPEENPELKRIMIEDLNFSTGVYLRMNRAGIRNVADLVQKSEEDLRRIRGFGDGRIHEVKEKLSEYGLTLKESV